MSLVKCPNCGLMVSDDTGSCFACGYLLPSPQSYTSPTATAEIIQSEQTYQISQDEIPLNEQIRRMQIADNVIQEVFKYINSADEKKESAGVLRKSGQIGCGTIIIGWFVFSFVVILVVSLFANHPTMGYICVLLIIAAVIFFIIKKSINKSGMLKELRIQEDTDRLHAEEILQNNAQAIAFIPKNYRFPLATGYMREMFESGRVRNMNEALDKYDEYEHRLKMEMSQSALLEQMEAQQAQIASASAAATVGAAASVINLLTSF